MKDFDEFLKFLVDQDVRSKSLLEFLKPRAEVEYYGKKIADPEERDLDKRKPKEAEQEIPEVTYSKNKQLLKSFASGDMTLLKDLKDDIQPVDEFTTSTLGNARTMREESISSCLEDMEYTVSITTTYNSGVGYKKHTMYEIEITTPQNNQVVSRRFTEFKKLDDRIRKKYGRIGQLPTSGMGVSSTDPRVVADRRFKLQKYLEDLISREEIRTDPGLLEFLELDKLI